MGATLNGTRVVSARLFIPWQGVWWADLDLDPDDATNVPTSGKATLTVGDAPGPVTTLVGTIDPRFTGTFVATVRMRLVGGAGGWDKPVGSKHFNAPGALMDRDVYTETAGEVGETVSMPSPKNIGDDFGRAAGQASAVFLDTAWHVEPTTGVTVVAPRAPAPADATLEILSWDAGAARAELTCDALVIPGTPLVDERIPAAMVVRDVEQTFDGARSRATAWCSSSTASSPASRLAGVMTALVRQMAQTPHLKVYRYRVVQAAGDGPPNTQWALQAIGRDATTGLASPMPDLIPAGVWSGVSGCLAQLALGLEVLVEFLEGDPTLPVVRGFSTLKLPVNLTVDASGAVHVGPTATSVDIAGGGSPVARLGDQVQSFLPPTLPVFGTVGGSTFSGTITVANPITGTITGGSKKATSG